MHWESGLCYPVISVVFNLENLFKCEIFKSLPESDVKIFSTSCFSPAVSLESPSLSAAFPKLEKALNISIKMV